MATISTEFANYCCELLSVLGPCKAKRMFGGWGISTDGLTVAILADLGKGEILWLKGDEQSRKTFEAAGCARFTYDANGKAMGINYFSAPTDAMESPALMAPWARLAMQAALSAQAAKKPKTPAKKPAKPSSVGAKKSAPGRPKLI